MVQGAEQGARHSVRRPRKKDWRAQASKGTGLLDRGLWGKGSPGTGLIFRLLGA
jgi:hypothetical protein